MFIRSHEDWEFYSDIYQLFKAFEGGQAKWDWRTEDDHRHSYDSKVAPGKEGTDRKAYTYIIYIKHIYISKFVKLVAESFTSYFKVRYFT